MSQVKGGAWNGGKLDCEVRCGGDVAPVAHNFLE